MILIRQEQKKRNSEEIQNLEMAQQVKPKSHICKNTRFSIMVFFVSEED